MAAFIISDAYVEIDGVDLSDYVRQVSIDYEAETPDSTAMGDTTKERLPGLTGWKMEVEFNQDYDASAVNATLMPLAGAAAFTIAVRPTSEVVGATNPSFEGDALLSAYNPLSGKIGEVATTKVTLQGTGVLDRAVA